MPLDFQKTFFSLEQEKEKSYLRYLVIAISFLVICVWAAWLFLGKVPVYETSSIGRIEVSYAGSPIATTVEGRVVKHYLQLGRDVKLGETLLELDDTIVRRKMEGLQSRLKALHEQVAAKERENQIIFERATQLNRYGTTSVEQAKANYNKSLAEAKFAEETEQQQEILYRKGLASLSAYSKARSEADQRRAQIEAARLEGERQRVQSQMEVTQARARQAELTSTVAELKANIANDEATLLTLAQELKNHQLRAPLAGRIGEIANLQTGSVLKAGQQVATIVPSGRLRAVAYFEPRAALGKLVPGQLAKILLAGFPATQYGVLHGKITSVGSEVREGLVRVEFQLLQELHRLIPIQHGLPGQAVVEVEKVSPWALILRATGKLLRAADKQAQPAQANADEKA